MYNWDKEVIFAPFSAYTFYTWLFAVSAMLTFWKEKHMKIVLALAIIILLIVLAFKLSKKILKAVVMLIFVGFIVYLVTGTNIISDILSYFGIDNSVSDLLNNLRSIFWCKKRLLLTKSSSNEELSCYHAVFNTKS